MLTLHFLEILWRKKHIISVVESSFHARLLEWSAGPPSTSPSQHLKRELQGKIRGKSTKRPNKRIMMEICVFKLVDKAHAEEAQGSSTKGMNASNKPNQQTAMNLNDSHGCATLPR